MDRAFSPNHRAAAADDLRNSDGWRLIQDEIEELIRQDVNSLINYRPSGNEGLVQIGRYQGAIAIMSRILKIPDNIFDEVVMPNTNQEEEVISRIPNGL